MTAWLDVLAQMAPVGIKKKIRKEKYGTMKKKKKLKTYRKE